MKIKYEALRLFLAGTALTLTAMLSSPSMMQSSSAQIHLEKSVSQSVYNFSPAVSKKGKHKHWDLASYAR